MAREAARRRWQEGASGRRRQEIAAGTRMSGAAAWAGDRGGDAELRLGGGAEEAATGRQRRPGDYRCGARLDRQRAATALINESSSSVQKKNHPLIPLLYN
jgi:hypothetical protein